MKLLLCEICRTPLAMFDPADLSVPLTGAMFKPRFIDRECPPTFHPSVGQEDIVCPQCLRRPFNDPHRLLTMDGWIEIPDAEDDMLHLDGFPGNGEAVEEAEPLLIEMQSNPLACPYCGKVCGSKIGLVSHIRNKHKDVDNG
jgi:hypothetical protein